ELPNVMTCAARRAAATALMERRRQRAQPNQWDGSTDYAGEQAQCTCKRERHGVETHFLEPWKSARGEGDEETYGAPAERQTNRAAGDREPSALGQEVAGDAAGA